MQLDNLRERINFGLSELLGIELVSATSEAVVGQFRTGAHHLTEGGRVHGGALMAFGDTLGAYGAILNLPARATTATLESKSHFFRPAELGILTGEAVPLHVGRRTMVWQTTIHDEDQRKIAMITQTQMVLENSDPPVLASSESHHEGEHELKPVATFERAGRGQRSSIATDRRAQIMQAAFNVISSKGFASASMREIAQAAAMPVATMYQYVESKDEMLASIFDIYLIEVEARVTASSERFSTSREKLRAAVGANLEQFDEYQAHIRVMNRETRSLRPDVRARVKEHMVRYIGLFQSIAEEGMASGEFRQCDPWLVANLIAMLCEVWPLRQWSVGRYGLDTVRDAIVDLVMNGILAEAEQTG